MKGKDHVANLIPFRGILYDPGVVSDIAQVVAPPYDVIDAAGQEALYARHPYNVIRLELGKSQAGDGPADNRYTRAAAHLREWLRLGVLRRDAAPAVYPYTIEYRIPSGEYRIPSGEPGLSARVLKGFLSVVELEEFGTGRIFPHENTRSQAKTDRLNLLEVCRANFSPIFSLFSDPDGGILQLLEKSVHGDSPRLDFSDDSGFRHRIWSITAPDLLREIRAAMAANPLFIADGHHRYETALSYRRLRHRQAGTVPGDQPRPYDGVLMLFSSLEDPGLTVLPTHRVLRAPLPSLQEVKARLRDLCTWEEHPFQNGNEANTRRRILSLLRERGRTGPAFGLALKHVPAYLLLALHPARRLLPEASPRERLDVSILHNLILRKLRSGSAEEEAVFYTKDEHEALDMVHRGEGEAAFLLNPTKVSEVREVAAAGERMPHKSTYFFPKPLTGLVMNVFEE